ncbi:MAG: aminoglycoside phosphotransferase family protein [Candidatus Promineifilaceae bacterium]
MFGIKGDLLSVVPYGNGHINDTYLATYSISRSEVRYIHQRINHQVFPDPIALMENFERVTSHIAGGLQENGVDDIERRVLSPLRSRAGRSFAYDEARNVWRTTHFVRGTTTFDIVTNQELAFEVGRCYGEFQTQLLTLAPDSLHTTIADFHNTRHRFDTLQQAIGSDPWNRASKVRDEIAFVEARESYVDRLEDLHIEGLIPKRITHNDTKVNNLLIDKRSGRGICVTDLDTTMPGLALHDFGDMVRTTTNNAAEDEQNLDLVRMQIEIFEPLARGYLSKAGQFLNTIEMKELIFSCKVIVLEIGIRFLTDHLQGDVYFKTGRKGHNLDRCRTQFKLLTSIEEQEELMELIVASIPS